MSLPWWHDITSTTQWYSVRDRRGSRRRGDAGSCDKTFQLPEGYAVKDDCILREKKVETEHGIATEWERVSTYQMYIKSIFFDPGARDIHQGSNQVPHTWVEEHDFPVEVLSSLGKEFSAFLLNTQVFGFKTAPQQES